MESALATGWYDERKRAITLAVLPERRYRRGFEPGCGVGDLTLLLADRCDELVSWDPDPALAAHAATRTAALAHVRIDLAAGPQQWPDGRADLIVLHDIGGRLTSTELDALLDRCAGALQPGGSVVGVHWRPAVSDHPMGGDDVHARMFGRREWERVGGYTDQDIRIDVFDGVPPPVRSVSTRGRPPG